MNYNAIPEVERLPSDRFRRVGEFLYRIGQHLGTGWDINNPDTRSEADLMNEAAQGCRQLQRLLDAQPNNVA